MSTVWDILGFATVESALWHAAAYTGALCAIVGMHKERVRDPLVFLGSAILGLYSWFFFRDFVFTAMQFIISLSAALGVLSMKKTRVPVIVILVVGFIGMVAHLGLVTELAVFAGVIGLALIAVGIAVLPKVFGYIVLVAGSLCMGVYSFEKSAFVFLFLNAYFAALNMYLWRTHARQAASLS